MKINPQLFDKNGLIRLGSGYPTDVKWYPLYAEDKDNNFLAASYSTGEIKLFSLKENGKGNKSEIILERIYVADEPSGCNCFDWSPNGQYLVGGYEDGRLRMFDIFNDKRVNGFNGMGNDISVCSVSFSPDGSYIVSGSVGSMSKITTLELFNAMTGKVAAGFNCKVSFSLVEIKSVRFSPDGRYIVSMSTSCTNPLVLIDAKQGERVNGLTYYDGNMYSKPKLFNISKDCHYLVGAYSDTLKLLDVKTGRDVTVFNGMGFSHISSASFSPDGRYIVTGLYDGILKLWDVNASKEVECFYGTGHSDCIITAIFSPDGRYILSASSDSAIKLWDVKIGKELSTFNGRGHVDFVQSISFSPDGQKILSGSARNNSQSRKDTTLNLWDVNTGMEVFGLDDSGHTDHISFVSFSPDGRYIVSGSEDNTLRLLNANSGKRVSGFYGRGHTDFVFNSSFSPDGSYIVSGSNDKTLKLWDAKTGKEKVCFGGSGHTEWVRSVRFSPDGRYIVTRFADTLKLWNTKTGKVIPGFDVREHTGFISSFSFSPDGCNIVTGDDILKLWDARAGNEVASFDVGGDTKSISSVGFSPDGRYILSGSYSNTLNIWDAKTGKEVIGFFDYGHTSSVFCVAFSPNGRYIVSGSRNGIVFIHNLEQILDPGWAKEHLDRPLILTGVWFPDDTLDYLRETKQGNIVDNRPLARCGECGMFFPVEDNMLGRELRCSCKRLVKLNEFTAGVER